MKARYKLLLAIAVVWGLKVGLTFLVGRSLAFPVLRGLIGLQHPAIEWVAPADLAAWLSDSSRERPLVLDVRTPAEYSVSHLPGAERIDPDAPIPARLLALPRSTPIVTYCAVGYRSAAAAERLRQAGFTRVWNLSGSIFRWANEGRPLEGRSGPTDRVHPISWWWGRLLRPDRRAGLAAPLEGKT